MGHISQAWPNLAAPVTDCATDHIARWVERSNETPSKFRSRAVMPYDRVVTCAVHELLCTNPTSEPAQTSANIFGRPKSCGQLLGESWPRAIRSGTGRGGDMTGSRVSVVSGCQ
jgi:hypothetical protein